MAVSATAAAPSAKSVLVMKVLLSSTESTHGHARCCRNSRTHKNLILGTKRLARREGRRGPPRLRGRGGTFRSGSLLSLLSRARARGNGCRQARNAAIAASLRARARASSAGPRTEARNRRWLQQLAREDKRKGE